MRLAGKALMVCGAVLVAFYIGARVHTVVGASDALAQFTSPAAPGDPASSEPDTSLWSEGRIRAFRETMGLTFDPPLGVLRIPSAGLEVPVLRGTDDASLNRGLGWIEGTTLPGQRGNIGLAGHRDGFFRVLKDVGAGDLVELATADGSVEYVIVSTEVIEPEDVHVLGPTDGPMLTLVTCYPFYFVGSAPQRYIVRAVPRETPNGPGDDELQRCDRTETPDQHPGSNVSQPQSINNQQQQGGTRQ